MRLSLMRNVCFAFAAFGLNVFLSGIASAQTPQVQLADMHSLLDDGDTYTIGGVCYNIPAGETEVKIVITNIWYDGMGQSIPSASRDLGC